MKKLKIHTLYRDAVFSMLSSTNNDAITEHVGRNLLNSLRSGGYLVAEKHSTRVDVVGEISSADEMDRDLAEEDGSDPELEQDPEQVDDDE